MFEGMYNIIVSSKQSAAWPPRSRPRRCDRPRAAAALPASTYHLILPTLMLTRAYFTIPFVYFIRLIGV